MPKCPTVRSGEYVVPFFWDSTQVPGSIASALAMRWYSDNSYTPQNKHGQLDVGVDVKKLIGVVAPPIPADGKSAASMFLKFWMASDKELKGLGMVTRFISSTKLISAELQGCYSNIDFFL